jgi:hypothetical protein
MIECFKLGLYWRGINHDLSKFLPSEFFPYANYFYGNYRSYKDASTYEKTYHNFKYKEDVEREFDIAWLKHIHRNPHHWQHWILREDDGETKTIQMPEIFLEEMIADWIGAGKAITGKDNLKEWWDKNKHNILVGKSRREYIEMFVNKRLNQ